VQKKKAHGFCEQLNQPWATDSCYTKCHWSRFLSKFLRFSFANHHSTIAPHSALNRQHTIIFSAFTLRASSVTRNLFQHEVGKLPRSIASY
jgi:hypothetical protein